MTSLLPVAVYGLEVPAGDIIVPAVPDFPATFRITMAAIDPSAAPESGAETNGHVAPRATLKIIRQPPGPGPDDSDEEGYSDDEDYLNALLGEADSDDEDETSDDDDEKNGGPSDPSKSKKARKEQAVAELKKVLSEEEEMEVDTETPNGANGAVAKIDKGKAKATGGDSDGDEDDEDDEEDLEIEEFVLCTLDPEKTLTLVLQNYQQPLDITVAEDEAVFFKVTGTHKIYLTGNYVVPADGALGRQDDGSDEDDEYDLSPDEDELEGDESDELDELEDPRITELHSEEEKDVPKLAAVKQGKKGKNKRAAEDSDAEPTNLDDIMAKSLKPEAATNGEQKLSKKQMKKLKNNAGEPVEVAAAPDHKEGKKGDKAIKESPGAKGDKKVQFAKDLEQGPSGADKGGKASLGVKVVQGVTVDDKKLGSGPAAKKGNTVSMRYIGKLQSNGMQFDANKAGAPFNFKLGAGEVIKGWDIGVAGMSVGGERRLIIPANLAYGKKKAGQIPANSTLVFDVKLLGIK
ncbi:MAG: peptidylprolyl isomerase fpr4 [Thelocarpon impressellum]|nr:MAG: peptidylprolyl isomerase fpr4 [Thelocarpon impressellum]